MAYEMNLYDCVLIQRHWPAIQILGCTWPMGPMPEKIRKQIGMAGSELFEQRGKGRGTTTYVFYVFCTCCTCMISNAWLVNETIMTRLTRTLCQLLGCYWCGHIRTKIHTKHTTVFLDLKNQVQRYFMNPTTLATKNPSVQDSHRAIGP